MTQSRTHSMLEQVASTAVGFAISMLVWEFIVKPIWSLNTDFVQNIQITLLFTVVSLARGYGIRRVSNFLAHKKYKKNRHEQSNATRPAHKL